MINVNHPSVKQSGSILVFVIWVLVMMAIFAAAIGQNIRQRVRVVQTVERREELRLLAEAGWKKALYLLQSDKIEFDALSDAWRTERDALTNIKMGNGRYSVLHPAGLSLAVGLSDEESKINLNRQKSPLLLKRLLDQLIQGLPGDSDSIAQSIVDWKDEDDDPYDSGAESKYYQTLNPPYRSANRNFSSLEELRYVKGVTPEVYGLLMPHVTIYSNGLVNLNTASTAVLQAYGFSKELTQKIIKYRNGPDGMGGTKDDGIFMDLRNVIGDLETFFPIEEEERIHLKDFLESGQFSVASQYYTSIIQTELEHSKMMLLTFAAYDRFGSVRAWHEQFKTTV